MNINILERNQKKMKNNQGITLISLSIAIIVLIILASISIITSVVNVDSVKDNIVETELVVLQNAVLQRYTKFTISKNPNILVGSTVTSLDSTDWTSLGITNTSNYKELSPSDLADLGISNYKSDYIYVINYINGDVIIKTSDGVLYNM